MKRWWSVGAMLLLFVVGVRAPHAQTAAVRQAWLRHIAGDGYARPNFARIAARLVLRQDTALCYGQLDSLLARPYGDMFWAIGSAGFYYAARDVLRPEYQRKIREDWARFTPYRGDTPNHFLMYYAAWLLMAQAYPHEDGRRWFDGKSSEENYADAASYLETWAREIGRDGQTEWASPRYAYYYITPLVLLSEYTRDAKLKSLFTNALELELAKYAANYLDGNFCGAHSRVGASEALCGWDNEARSYGAYFFGDSVQDVLEDVAFAAMSKFECPAVIRAIARDRSKPVEMYDFERGRTTIRDAVVRNAPVYRYTWKTRNYALGSMQGGIVQPIQQQSWSLVLNDGGKENVITSLNPYVDSTELMQFFPEYPQFMMERIDQAKAGYTSEDKWVGGSPFERIYQQKHCLLATYSLPKHARYHHADLYLPASRTAEALPQDSASSRWIFREYGATRVGIYCFGENRMMPDATGGTRVRMDGPRPMMLVYVSDDSSETYAQFTARLLRSKPVHHGAEVVSSGDLGRTFRFDLNGAPNPVVARYGTKRWLLHSPNLESKLGSGVVVVKRDGAVLRLKF